MTNTLASEVREFDFSNERLESMRDTFESSKEVIEQTITNFFEQFVSVFYEDKNWSWHGSADASRKWDQDHFEMINYEADDLIATYSKQITKLGSDVTIVSSDKDLMQLHDKKVRIYDPMKNKFIKKEDVIAKFGVTSDKVIDVQSLAGDSSDNVPGVPGIGVKTAAELINKFGSLEELLKNAETIKQNKRRETIIENKDKALISKKLVTLKNDEPVKNKLDDFLLKEIDKKKLFNFLRDMEFNRLLSSAISTYGEIDFENKNKEQARKTKDNLSKSNYNLIKSEDELKKLIHKIEEVGELAIDTETNSLNPHLAKLVGISISFKIGEAYYVPLNHSNGKNLDEKNILKILKPLLEDKTIKKIGQNIKFDYIIFYHRGIEMKFLEDTMLMSYVLDAGKNKHNMDELSKIHLDHQTISYKDLVGTGKKQITFDDVDIDQAKDYAAEDADVTYRLYKKFLKDIKEEKLVNIYESFEKPMIEILAKMEISGIKLDKDFLNSGRTKSYFKKNFYDLLL